MPIQNEISMTKAIKIYHDEGIAPSTQYSLLRSFSSYNIQTINAKQVCNTMWEESTELLIIAGGRDVLYHRKLQGKGNRKIRQFVENGGSYLGICAGGYYGASSIEFDKGYPLEVLEKRELGFFPYTATGPAFGGNTYCYDSQSGARASLIRFGSIDAHIYYNGGCYFFMPHSHPDIRILAMYQELSQPAIIACKVGRGSAILSGVHFEVAHDDLPSSDYHLEKIIPLLCESEAARKSIFSEIIQPLTQQAGNPAPLYIS